MKYVNVALHDAITGLVLMHNCAAGEAGTWRVEWLTLKQLDALGHQCSKHLLHLLYIVTD